MTDARGDTRLWPTTPYELADPHRCPSCFALVSASICSECGLTLTDPRAGRLLELGRGILATELERQTIMDAIRSTATESARASAVPVAPVAAPRAAPAASAPAPPAAVSLPAPEPVQAPPAAPLRSSPAPVEPAAPRRRRLTVPVLLLIVGVSLVGIAAVFFVLLAWFVAGIAVRALIIGVVTAATIAIASLLRRRALTTTAEGIAALGVVLLGLDAWAARANDLFGSGSSQPAVYAGIAALVVAVLCRAWSRLTSLRVPDLAASLAVPAGIGLLLGGLLSVPTPEAVVAGLLGAGAGGLAHALPAPWSAARSGRDSVPERVILAIAGITGLVFAAFVVAFATTGIAVVWWAGGVIIVLAAVHVLLLRRRGDDLPASGALVGVASGLGVAVAATLGWQLVARTDGPVYPTLVAPVLAVLVAVLLDRVRARSGFLTPAAITGAVVGAGSILVVVVSWAMDAAAVIDLSWIAWRTDAFAAPATSDVGVAFAVIAAAVIAVLLFLASSLDRPVLRDARPLVAAAVLLAATARTGVVAVIVGAGILVTVVGAVALFRSSARVGWLAAGALGAGVAYVAGIATPWLWMIAVAAAVVLPIAQRIAVHAEGTAAVVLALAPVGVAVVSAFIAPTAIASALDLGAVDGTPALALLQWVAVVSAGVAVVVRLDSRSRHALAYAGMGLTAATLAWAAVPGVLDPGSADRAVGEPIAGIARAAILLILLALIALGGTAVTGRAAFAAAFALAPLGAFGVHSVLAVIGGTAAGWAPLCYVGVAALLVWVAAGVTLRRTDPRRHPLARTGADLGALVTTLALSWGVADDLRGALLAVIGAGIVGASLAPTWAAPDDGRAVLRTTRAIGEPLDHEPRRLLAWPAFAALTLALWTGLASAVTNPPIEAFVLPPAALLLAFAALLLWLRRIAESTLATMLGIGLGLVAPAVDGTTGPPLRGILIAVVAALVALALTWTPLRRITPVAIAGSIVALFALTIVGVDRAWRSAPVESLWLLLLVAVALLAAVGIAMVGDDLLRNAEDSAARPIDPRRLFAQAIPPLTLAVAVPVAAIAAFDERDPWAFGVVLLVALGVHVAASTARRPPLSSPLRWTALALAAAAAVVAALTDTVREVEYASLPVAVALLLGVALRARTTPGGMSAGGRIAWMIGVGAAIAPSLLAPADPLRVWLVIAATLAVAVALVLAPIGDVARLKAPTAIVLTGGAIAMSLRALLSAPDAAPEVAAIVAGAGAVAVAAGLIRIGPRDRSTTAAPVIAAIGAILTIATVALRLDGGFLPTALVALGAGALGVGGAFLLGSPRWRGFGGVVTVGGALTAVIAVAVRFLHIAPPSRTAEPDLWALAGLLVIATIGSAALRASTERIVGIVVGVGLTASVALFTAAEASLLGDAGAGRALFAMGVVSAAGAVGFVWRRTFVLVLVIGAASVATVFAIYALGAAGIRPVEAVTFPPALAGIVVGVQVLRSNPRARSWPALGPGLVLLTVPSLLHDFFGGTDLWRIVTLGVVAIALVLVGGMGRLQAPLVLGSVVLLIHAVAQLWPWIAAAYVAVWWLWLGLGGAALIFLAARYEKRMQNLRSAYAAVTSLR